MPILLPFQYFFRFAITMLLLDVTVMIASGQEPKSTATPATTVDTESNAQSASMTQIVEAAIVNQTNDFRQSNGLAPVERDEYLTQAAKQFAAFMAETSKYGHRANGMTPAERAVAAGYDYCVVRENIAYRMNTGEVTAASLTEVFVQGWIDSPPHRENMLADYAAQTGVAVATTDDVTYYAVQMLGRPKSAAFRVKLTNDSNETKTIIFQANDQKDQVELQPRMIVTMTRCFPTTVSLDGSEKSKKVTSDATFSVTADGLVDHR